MNEFINNAQPLDICKDCPWFWIRVKKNISETWVDSETREFCAHSQFELVCDHAEACRRAVRICGRQG